MPIDDIYEESELNMMESIDALEDRIRGIRTGRPNPALVTSISIDAYGAQARVLKQCRNSSDRE